MSRRLITDRDVLEGRTGPRIVLDGATIITPAARDRALRMGIVVVEADAALASPARAAMPSASAPAQSATGGCVGCGQSACSGGCGAGCAHCGSASCSGACSAGATPIAGGPTAFGAAGAAQPFDLPDGLYLVRIEGGRAVSTLPAAGPGLMPRAKVPCAEAVRATVIPNPRS